MKERVSSAGESYWAVAADGISPFKMAVAWDITLSPFSLLDEEIGNLVADLPEFRIVPTGILAHELSRVRQWGEGVTVRPARRRLALRRSVLGDARQTLPRRSHDHLAGTRLLDDVALLYKL